MNHTPQSNARPARKRGRRHPIATIALVAIGLLGTGGVYALATSSATAETTVQAQEQVANGGKLFAANCATCHGMALQGTPDGPTLIGVGAASVDFQMSTGRMPMARPGEQAPRKVNTYTAEEIGKISAYVAQLGPGPAVPNSSQYDYSGLSEEQIARGGELFRTNCSACHQAAANGGALPNGKYAPSLHGVEPLHIYEAVRTGPQQMPVFAAGAIPDEDLA